MKIQHKILIAIGLILFAVATRFLPHLWNFTALTAVAIFAGNYLGFRWSVPIVLSSMLISDLFIGFYDWKLMFVVYTSFVLAGALPILFKGNSVFKIGGLSVFGSILFFLTTNWAVWFFGDLYANDFSGLIASYIAGIPFLKNALIGDLWYTFVLFGVYEFSIYFLSQRQTKIVSAFQK